MLVNLTFYDKRRLALARVHLYDTVREIAIFHRRNTSHHFYRLDIYRADGTGRGAWALLLQCGKAPLTGPAGDAAAALSRSLSRSRLQKLTDCLHRYAAECRYNVGPGHVLGALAAEWEAILG